jgi:hypothetical protein
MLVIILFLILLGIYFGLLQLKLNTFITPVFKNTKIIWIFWDDVTTIPAIIKTNIESITQLFPDWNIILLNRYNIYHYIPNSIVQLADGFIIQHQTDLYRLYLLKYYGGLWLDAGILIKDTYFINNLYKQCLTTNKIGLYDIKKNNLPIIENWFIMSPIPNHYIIDMWYQQFVNALQIGFKSYQEEIKQIVSIEHIGGGEYLTMHCCMQYMTQNNPNILNDMIMHHSENDMFYIQHVSNWKSEDFKQMFINIAHTLPCIKLRGIDRDAVKDLDANLYFYNQVNF